MENREGVPPADETAGLASQADKRKDRRSRVLKSAVVAFNQNFSTTPCVMRNLSATGARLEFDDSAFVPRCFTLFVELDGYKIDCELVWHAGRQCGVRFIGEKIPVRAMRSQVLKSSQEALSERVVREMELRGARERTWTPPPPQLPAEPRLAPLPRSPAKSGFGKR